MKEKYFWLLFAGALVVNLILLGVAVWAVVEIVQWVTSQ